MAKLVYAMDLKSIGRNSPCRFESGSRHQQIVRDVLDPNRIAQCVRPGARRGMSMPQPANDHFVPAACTTRPSYDAQQQNPARTERLEQQSLAVNVVSALHIVCSKVSQCRRKAWIALDCRPESAALGLGLAQLSPGIRLVRNRRGCPSSPRQRAQKSQRPAASRRFQCAGFRDSDEPRTGVRVEGRFREPVPALAWPSAAVPATGAARRDRAVAGNPGATAIAFAKADTASSCRPRIRPVARHRRHHRHLRQPPAM